MHCYGMWCFLWRQIWHSHSWLLYRDTVELKCLFSLNLLHRLLLNAQIILNEMIFFDQLFFFFNFLCSLLLSFISLTQSVTTDWHQNQIVYLVSLCIFSLIFFNYFFFSSYQVKTYFFILWIGSVFFKTQSFICLVSVSKGLR